MYIIPEIPQNANVIYLVCHFLINPKFPAFFQNTAPCSKEQSAAYLSIIFLTYCLMLPVLLLPNVGLSFCHNRLMGTLYRYLFHLTPISNFLLFKIVQYIFWLIH